MAGYTQLNGADAEEFSVKILSKEKTHSISPIQTSTTISELKTLVETATGIPTSQQRLIFSGKSLQPDSSTMESFNIKNNSVIHLFPLPVATPQITHVQANAVSNIINPIVAQLRAVPTEELNGFNFEVNTNEEIRQLSEPVKMWSFILVFSSSMTLFNYCMNLLTLGIVGSNIFDTCVNTTEALLSVAGVYVGQIGLDVTQVIDFDKLNRFVRLLVAVGVGCIILRCFWVADIILEAKALIESNEKNPSDKATSDGPVLTRADLPSFIVQALIIGSIFVVAWLSCMYRAVKFRDAVSTFDHRQAITAVPAAVVTQV